MSCPGPAGFSPPPPAPPRPPRETREVPPAVERRPPGLFGCACGQHAGGHGIGSHHAREVILLSLEKAGHAPSAGWARAYVQIAKCLLREIEDELTQQIEGQGHGDQR